MYKLSTIFLVAITLLMMACTQSQEQRDFEREAFRSPSGITETSATGEVIDEDPDDWRISPLFMALVEVRPPFPNPVSLGTASTFEISLTGVQSIDGVRIFELLTNNNRQELFNTMDTQSAATLVVWDLDPAILENLGNGNGPRGLHRIIITDFNEQVISYGDIRVE